MDNNMFKKMKLKEGMTACILYAPPEYPDFKNFSDIKDNKYNFVHLFITSKEDFCQRFSEATEAISEDGIFWVSYPKSDKKQKYDINRDSLWGLVIPLRWHPVAQVSLDENWSAVRLKRNEANVEYKRPNNVKR